METIRAFDDHRERWKERRGREPKAWDALRKEFHSIFRDRTAEEYMFLLADYPDILTSFLSRNHYGNITFKHKALSFRKNTRRDFLAHLLETPRLHSYIQSSELDSLFFKEYADAIFSELGDIEKRALLAMSLRSTDIETGDAILGQTAEISNREGTPASAGVRFSAPSGCYFYRQSTPLRAFRYPVTQTLFHDIMGYNPSLKVGCTRPVHNVGWGVAVLFCNRLSIRHGLKPYYELPDRFEEWLLEAEIGDYTSLEAVSGRVMQASSGLGFRLPFEEEWEYMARAGTENIFSGSDFPERVAIFGKKSVLGPFPVAQRKKNAFSLHDMSGNIQEWCASRSVNGFALRGGDWSSKKMDVCVHVHRRPTKYLREKHLGFRPVRTVSSPVQRFRDWKGFMALWKRAEDPTTLVREVLYSNTNFATRYKRRLERLMEH
ncbi:MAG: SUMF1/EgtB/PvdO family nonheme iron enzyme [Myxococcota bacterium]|nr:SUMF1/EgtB/PvdO family nonheme iron enzyme [Myxococcota bacterium]